MSWRRCVRKRFSWRPFVGPYRFEKGRKPRRSRSDSPRNAALRKRFPMARCALAHAPVNFSPPPTLVHKPFGGSFFCVDSTIDHMRNRSVRARRTCVCSCRSLARFGGGLLGRESRRLPDCCPTSIVVFSTRDCRKIRLSRSEERRVGKECRSRRWRYSAKEQE